MKKGIFLIFGALFLLLAVSSVSAVICKGNDGYYRDCGYNNYYGKMNYHPSSYGSNLGYDYNNKDYYQNYGRDYGYNKNVINLGGGFNRGYDYGRNYDGRVNVYYATSSNDYKGYNRRYNVDRIPASYNDRNVFTKNLYLNNDKNRKIYLGGYNNKNNFYFERWVYKKSYDCPRGWNCVSGDRDY